MPEIRSIGLQYIKIGDIAGDGGMGTVLAALGLTYQDTADLTQGDPEITEIYAEEVDDPVEVIETKAVKGFKWSIFNYDPATLVKVLGGEVIDNEWHAPSGSVSIEKSVEALSTNNVRYQATRCKLIGKINAQFRKKGVALVDIEAKILTPTKTGESSLRIKKITTT